MSGQRTVPYDVRPLLAGWVGLRRASRLLYHPGHHSLYAKAGIFSWAGSREPAPVTVQYSCAAPASVPPPSNHHNPVHIHWSNFIVESSRSLGAKCKELEPSCEIGGCVVSSISIVWSLQPPTIHSDRPQFLSIANPACSFNRYSVFKVNFQINIMD